MCILCVEIQTNKLTFKEAFRNFREMKESIDDEHQLRIIKLINEKRLSENKSPQSKKNP